MPPARGSFLCGLPVVETPGYFLSPPRGGKHGVPGGGGSHASKSAKRGAAGSGYKVKIPTSGKIGQKWGTRRAFAFGYIVSHPCGKRRGKDGAPASFLLSTSKSPLHPTKSRFLTVAAHRFGMTSLKFSVALSKPAAGLLILRHHPPQDPIDACLVTRAFRLQPVHHFHIHAQRNPLLAGTIPARVRSRRRLRQFQ